MSEDECDNIPLKDTEHYKNHHQPWMPNYILGNYPSEHVEADSIYYLMVNLFQYELNQKAQETNKVIFSGLVGNGILKFLLESFAIEDIQKKRKGK